MLPERYRELLTAYVDGELSARQRRALEKLLRRSAEARKLLKQMQADSHELRALAPPRLEQDLSDSVLTLIAQRQIQPPTRRAAPPPVPPPAVTGPFWPYLAVAAALLFAVGVASYLFFASSFESVRPTGPVAKEDHKLAPKDDPKRSADPKEATDKANHEPDDKQPLKPDDKSNPSTIIVKDKPDSPKPGDSPRPPSMDDAVTAPSMELFEVKKTEVAPPQATMRLHQLEQEGKRKVLLDELQKTTALRLELPCNNGTKAVDRIQAACKAENIALVIESTAQERLKKPHFKTNYVVYLEDVTPEELATWLQRVSTEDRKAEAKKQADPQLEALLLTPMTKQDHEQLSKLLGVDPATIQPKGPLGTDLRKPLSDMTLEQVSASLTGQGGAPRPVQKKVASKAPEQTALVLAYNPVRPNPKAAEIKRWLENRKPPRPGTLQILLVLRSKNA